MYFDFMFDMRKLVQVGDIVKIVDSKIIGKCSNRKGVVVSVQKNFCTVMYDEPCPRHRGEYSRRWSESFDRLDILQGNFRRAA